MAHQQITNGHHENDHHENVMQKRRSAVAMKLAMEISSGNKIHQYFYDKVNTNDAQKAELDGITTGKGNQHERLREINPHRNGQSYAVFLYGSVTARTQLNVLITHKT